MLLDQDQKDIQEQTLSFKSPMKQERKFKKKDWQLGFFTSGDEAELIPLPDEKRIQDFTYVAKTMTGKSNENNKAIRPIDEINMLVTLL
jgi:hypothetical protein